MVKRPTMRDVSEAAQVSVFTVSRAMTGGEGISEATRAHVQRVARELGYIPNQLARGLKGGVTKTVGVLTANTNNLYYAILVGAIERTLQTEGYHCIVMDAVLDGEYRTDREDAFVEDLLQHQVAAVVLTYPIAERHMATLAQHNVELVFVDSLPTAGYERYASVNSDNYAGSRLLGEHLLQHGYTGRWCFVGFTSSWSSRIPREQGYTDVARDAGIEVDVVEAGNASETAYEAVSSYLDGLSDAGLDTPRVVFTGNELLLQGTLKAARERGLTIPNDLAVVSYDDFEWAPYVEPPVTVVDQKVRLLGSRTAEALLARLDRNAPHASSGASSAEGERILVAPELVVRASCGC
jgi:LacI family transcriptional regulator